MKDKSNESICFITWTSRHDRPILDPSVRYRCYHPAEALSSGGSYCAIYSMVQFYKNPCFDFDIYIFHRPSQSSSDTRLSRILERLYTMNKIVIADYDDLIFGNDEIAQTSSIAKNLIKPIQEVELIFKNNLSTLLLFYNVTVSTESLAIYVKKFHPRASISVIHNIIPDALQKIHLQLGTAFRVRKKEYIGYFAGTKSHDLDLLIIEDVLHRVLLENKHYHLFIVGPIDVPRSLGVLPNVLTGDVVGYLRLPSLMTRCSTVIAPLEESVFNECKSRVKFLEAAITGCHLIATPIHDMISIGSEYITLAKTKNDWYNALTCLRDHKERTDEINTCLNYIKIDNKNYNIQKWITRCEY